MMREQAGSAKRPRNVIWITSDHMRYDCIGAHGNADMHTPNLDALVEGGISFERCYANNPVCMPSRCSFMTGLYPQQTQVMQNGHELRADFTPTAAHCFAHGGYRTVQIGKLHFQCHEDEDLDPTPKDRFGFEVFQLSEEPGCYDDAYMKWLRGERPDLADAFIVPRAMSPERLDEIRTFSVLDAPWECSHSGWIATQAARYLYGWGARKETQFLHLGIFAPHPPLNPTREMFAPYENTEISLTRSPNDWADINQLSDDLFKEYKRHFYALVTGVDLAVGKLVDTLKANGEYEDTLIVFSSDHGDACGDHGRVGKGPSYYESIMRLPLVFHWPKGLGAGGRRIGELVEMVDVLPTLLDLTHLPVPSIMQGRSYATAMRDGTPIDGREDVYAIDGVGDIMLRSEDFKYLRYAEENREVLYDLQADPNEFMNVAEQSEYAAPLRSMRERAFARTLLASQSPQTRRLRF